MGLVGLMFLSLTVLGSLLLPAPVLCQIQIESDDDKAFKICSVSGGMDVTRLVSSNTRNFFKVGNDSIVRV